MSSCKSAMKLSRLPGVGDVIMVGQRDYSMRVWVDPDKLADPEPDGRRRGRRHPGAEHPGGRRAHRSAADRAGQRFQVPLAVEGRLTDVEQFENIIVKTGADRRMIRLKDVARVELGPRTRTSSVTWTARSPRRSPSGSCPTPTPWPRRTSSRRRWRS